MENVMIVSCSEKAAALFSEILTPASVCQITAVQSCGQARRLLLERDFDLVIINAPLRDESGEAFARHAALSVLSQVILVVKSEYYEAVCAACEEYGVLTVSKPINKTVFWSVLSLARSARGRIKKMREENTRLKQKIEDIRVVDRAKCILISFMGMSEQEAHRYIEKQAMDMRAAKRAVAEDILKTYEN
ncbi:MAG TPA: response regulator receiver protein [Ruminococcaceae bacterium]|nr:response regulator receiver protein [Oscillospiraceae bacterium]